MIRSPSKKHFYAILGVVLLACVILMYQTLTVTYNSEPTLTYREGSGVDDGGVEEGATEPEYNSSPTPFPPTGSENSEEGSEEDGPSSDSTMTSSYMTSSHSTTPSPSSPSIEPPTDGDADQDQLLGDPESLEGTTEDTDEQSDSEEDTDEESDLEEPTMTATESQGFNDFSDEPDEEYEETEVLYDETSTPEPYNFTCRKCRTEPRKNFVFVKTHKTGTSTTVNIWYYFGIKRGLNYAVIPYTHYIYGIPVNRIM
eukprot:sb/3479717/